MDRDQEPLKHSRDTDAARIPTFVITGATSGIGLEIARAVVERAQDQTSGSPGIGLIIGGRRSDLLHERAGELRAAGAAVVELVVGDLSEESTVARFEQCIRDHTVVFLCNSAGFGVGGAVGADAPTDRLGQMIAVHAAAPLRLCAAVLPQMRARGDGTIINVGSLAGTVAVPGAATYVATKAFIERFSEGLALENACSGVVVQALTPGFVITDFHRDVEDARALRKNRGLIRWMEARDVANEALRRARAARARLTRHPGAVPLHRHVVVVPGWSYRFLALLSKAVPKSLLYRAATRARR